MGIVARTLPFLVSVVGLVMIAVAMITRLWYVSDDFSVGLFTVCHMSGGKNNATAIGRKCHSITEHIAPNITLTNAYNGCWGYVSAFKTLFQVGQAFAIAVASVAVALVLAASAASLCQVRPFALLLALVCMEAFAATVATATFYTAVRCVFATDDSGAGAAPVLFWIGAAAVTVSSVFVLMRQQPKDSRGSDPETYRSLDDSS